MSAEFAYKAEFDKIGEYLDEQLKAGSLFTAYLPGSPIRSSDNLESFKSSYDVQEYCYENNTDLDRYDYIATRELRAQLPEAIEKDQIRHVLDRAGVAEKPHSEDERQVITSLMNGEPAKVHIHEEVAVSDAVKEFVVIQQNDMKTAWETESFSSIVGWYNTYDNAAKAFHDRLDHEIETKEPTGRNEFRMVGRFDDVPLTLDERRCAVEGTGVTFKETSTEYNREDKAYEYRIENPHRMDDYVKMNVPRYFTVDKDYNTFQLHEQKPVMESAKTIGNEQVQVVDKQNNKDTGLSM